MPVQYTECVLGHESILNLSIFVPLVEDCLKDINMLEFHVTPFHWVIKKLLPQVP